MGLYLGEIVLRKEYVNYEPYYIYEDGEFKFLSKAERHELLPESEFTNINISAPAENMFLLQNVFKHKEFWFLEYDFSNLEPSLNSFGERNKTGYKITVTPEILQNCFHNMAWRNFYRLIDKCSINGDFKTNRVIFIPDDEYYVEPGTQVYIRIDDTMTAGPFTVEERKDDGRLYVTASEPSRKFVLPVRKFADGLKDYTEEFSGYSNCQTFVRIDENSVQGFFDTASDEDLLKNFRDYVNLDSANCGKIDLADCEKIARSYANSLFAGADVPREILAKRYERLMEIFAFEKDKVDIAAKIGEAEAHCVELEKKVEELEARRAALEKQIEELEAHRTDLIKQIENMERRCAEAKREEEQRRSAHFDKAGETALAELLSEARSANTLLATIADRLKYL